jgi:hypothetical protein
MSSPQVPIGTAKHGSGLGPVTLLQRITTIVGKETQLVASGPAVACRKRKPSFSAVLQCSGPFIHGTPDRLPGIGWFGKEVWNIDRGGRIHLCDKNALQASV